MSLFLLRLQDKDEGNLGQLITVYVSPCECSEAAFLLCV